MRDVAQQLAVLKRGVEQIVPEAEFVKKLGARSAKTGRSESSTASIRPESTSTWATRSLCASSVNSRTWAIRPSSSSATTRLWWATPRAATRPGPS